MLPGVKRVLFVCTVNRMRSPTAEALFRAREGLEVRSAGTDSLARRPVTDDLVAWADVIVVMESGHRRELVRRYGDGIEKRVVCLDIPDRYPFMDPELVELLEARADRFLGGDQP
jgi:predicted protein tyrosine phosphatase